MAKQLVTRQQLMGDLRTMGIETGDVVMVHCRMSALGWIPGGEQTVCEAIREVVGAAGTIVMPSQSWQLCDPAFLNDPELPEASWDQIRGSLPAFDKAVTPTRTMGAVAELFRTLPGTLRSDHPHRSVSASGPHAAGIVAHHALSSPMGQTSPFGALYDLSAKILLLGVGYDKCTAIHLAEDRGDYPGKLKVNNGAVVMVDGTRAWASWRELAVSAEDFQAVGAEFAATGLDRVGRVGNAEARVVPIRELVDFATEWFTTHRG